MGRLPALAATQAASTSPQLAAIASELHGRELPRVVVADDVYRDTLVSHGTPERFAEMFLGMFRAARNGDFATDDATLEQLIGRPTTTIREVLADDRRCRGALTGNRAIAWPSMIPVFDGHNDALTHPGFEALAQGRPGHIDVPKMRRRRDPRRDLRSVGGRPRRRHARARRRHSPKPDAQGGVRWDLPPAYDHQAAAASGDPRGRPAGGAGARRTPSASHGRSRRSTPPMTTTARRRRSCIWRAPRRSIPGLSPLSTGMRRGCAPWGPVWSRPTGVRSRRPVHPHTPHPTPGQG